MRFLAQQDLGVASGTATEPVGVAGAIGASFNTPLAGVIFAMEVVLMEYSLGSFAPVILASVSATTLTRMVYGSAPAFSVPAMYLGSAWELPIVITSRPPRLQEIAIRGEFLDAVLVRISHVDIPGTVHCYSDGLIHLPFLQKPAI